MNNGFLNSTSARYTERGKTSRKVHNNCPTNLISMAPMEFTTAVINDTFLEMTYHGFQMSLYFPQCKYVTRSYCIT